MTDPKTDPATDTETDPVEDTEYTYSYDGDEITLSKLCLSKMSANCGISDAYAIIRNSDGDVIDVAVSRAEKADVRTLSFNSSIDAKKWKEYAGQGYTVEIVC